MVDHPQYTLCSLGSPTAPCRARARKQQFRRLYGRRNGATELGRCNPHTRADARALAGSNRRRDHFPRMVLEKKSLNTHEVKAADIADTKSLAHVRDLDVLQRIRRYLIGHKRKVRSQRLGTQPSIRTCLGLELTECLRAIVLLICPCAHLKISFERIICCGHNAHAI